MPRRAIDLVLMGAVVLAGGCAVPAQTDTANVPRKYVCARAAGEVVIDGRLDEPAWQAAPWTEPFVDIRGAGGPPPRYETRARMLWDDRYLYVGAAIQEPHVWATLTRHDQIVYHDNDFEIFIDPDGDTREYCEVEINALNTIFDLFLVRTYIDGGPALHDWDLKGIRTAVHVEGSLNDPSDVDEGWSVEMALPWRALAPCAGGPVPPVPGDVWRVNFSRVQWRHRLTGGRYEKVPDTPEDNWVWSPQGVVNMHRPERWGYVTFSGAP
jgi:hypothetical protein